MNIYEERINKIRALMKERNINVYYVPMGDCHSSEYVDKHFKCIDFLSGFSGSAGHLIITADKAWLFADGRYYIQAAKQIDGSTVELMKWGLPEIPEPSDFIRDISKDRILGFDGAVVNAALALKISENAKDVYYSDDLAGMIWEDRPAQTFSEKKEFPLQYAGESSESKIERLRKQLKAVTGEGTYCHLINSIDDIAWLFNIRGNDIPCNPVVYAYAIITEDSAELLTNGNGYDSHYYEKAPQTDHVIMDLKRIGFDTYMYFMKKGAHIVDQANPSTAMKGIKNNVEIACLKEALKRDSAAVTKLMYWLKEEVFAEDADAYLDEVGVDEFITGLRAEDPLFLQKSFGTIAAYKENAAMMHYSATMGNAARVKPEGMLLVDSGAQYRDGTTDITRTFVLGPISEDEKKAFTLTAISMLRMLDIRFIEGCSGENLDIIARDIMWRNGLDYKCGTGHGVGHCLNVHEGPHNLKWKIPENGPTAVFKEGMVVTNEPGVYREGCYGVRTENEMVTVKYDELGNGGVTPDGKFLRFENLTFIPIDLDGINPDLMNAEDKKLLNNYHKSVYETLEPFFEGKKKEWLKKYTREI